MGDERGIAFSIISEDTEWPTLCYREVLPREGHLTSLGMLSWLFLTPKSAL